MSYSLLERTAGHVIANFPSEDDAYVYAAAEMVPEDEWALVEFGADPTQNRLVVADVELYVRAHKRVDFHEGVS